MKIYFIQESLITIVAEGPAVIITPQLLAGECQMSINVLPNDVGVGVGFESSTLELRDNWKEYFPIPWHTW